MGYSGQGDAMHGRDRHGVAWRGKARRGNARQGGFGPTDAGGRNRQPAGAGAHFQDARRRSDQNRAVFQRGWGMLENGELVGIRIIPMKRRELDPTKIDFVRKSHSNSSMLVEGVYPEGTSQEDVRKQVDGTFGGRFEQWGGGKFRFIAYTD